jgi:hypothetical protein
MPTQPKPPKPQRPRPWPLTKGKSLLDLVQELEANRTKPPKLSTLPPLAMAPSVITFPGGAMGVSSGRAVSLNGRAMSALATHELAKVTVWAANR